MSEFTPKVHRNISLPAGTHPPEVIRRTHSESDAEAGGILGAPLGGSSSSSLSSSTEQIDDQDALMESLEEEESSEPWSTRVSADILGTLSPKARKRQELIHELITSEVSHVRWLSILRRVFYIPLHRNNHLTESELNALFPNLPSVLHRHRKLCTDFKALSAASPVIKTKPIADALIATLGEPKYSHTLAKFCKGQRLALDKLRERRRRTKELHMFLVRCESDPRCSRLNLQALLACVWQRLTKYQLLLEGIVKTGKEEDADSQNPEDDGLVRIEQAYNIAKEVLHTVNTAVERTENLHRLKDIQSKLEVRGVSSTGSIGPAGGSSVTGGIGTVGGAGAVSNSDSEHGDLRKLDLCRHSLIMEGSLSIRQDGKKQVMVLALLLNECLVLLHRETERYILRPIPRSGFVQPLSPIIRWDRVMFRLDASRKYGMILLDIGGQQMYELAATNLSEYQMWIKHISEYATAQGTRSGNIEEGPPPPLPANPPPTTISSSEVISNGTSEPNTSMDEDKDENPEPEKEPDDTPISGAVQTVEGEPNENRRLSNLNLIAEDLVTPSSVAIASPPIALTAHRHLTPEERLRQAEEKVALALQEVAEAAKETVSARPSIYSAMNILVGQPDQRRPSLDNNSSEEQVDSQISTINLLLAAQSHVDNLTKVLLKALTVSPVDCSMTKCSLYASQGLCDTCTARHSKFSTSSTNEEQTVVDNGDADESEENAVGTSTSESVIGVCNTGLIESQSDDKMDSILILEEVGESSTDPCPNPDVDLVTTSAMGLREIFMTLIQRLPAEDKEREFLRARLQQADQRLHRLHHLHKDCVITENSNEGNVDAVQDVPNSNSTDQSGGEG